jgi:glycosyltransferase involved in cell wall biosynthesis
LKGLTAKIGLNELHNLGSFKISKLPAYMEADLLHIHCLHGGFFNYLALPRLTKAKPTVYTLHDMWPFTGHCVHSFDCERWKSGCGKCPYPDMPNAIRKDTTALEWKIKDWSYRRSHLTIIVPSTWLHDLASRSMLSRFSIQHIPHGVDTDIYRQRDREASRWAFGIPPGKKVLLHVSRRMSSKGTGYIKGSDLFVKVLQELPASLRKETVLLIIGEGNDTLVRELDLTVIPLGGLFNDRLKTLAYSAADLFIFPSRAETFGLVAIESLSCSTPVVAFRSGGTTDIVRPGVTGFLAEPENPKHFAEGIVRLLEDQGHLDCLRTRCREVALKEYNLDLYVQRHLALYREVIGPVAA